MMAGGADLDALSHELEQTATVEDVAQAGDLDRFDGNGG